jgi:hypothetical protein
MNIIRAEFDSFFFEHLYQIIKRQGVVSTKETLIIQGHHPAFVSAAIKKVQRKWGW